MNKAFQIQEPPKKLLLIALYRWMTFQVKTMEIGCLKSDCKFPLPTTRGRQFGRRFQAVWCARYQYMSSAGTGKQYFTPTFVVFLFFFLSLIVESYLYLTCCCIWAFRKTTWVRKLPQKLLHTTLTMTGADMFLSRCPIDKHHYCGLPRWQRGFQHHQQTHQIWPRRISHLRTKVFAALEPA